MRASKWLPWGLAGLVVVTGCANFRDREWGTCAVAGAVIGASVGGITGGVTTNNIPDDPSNGTRAGGILGGLAAGAILGGLLGHVICDPEKTAPPPPPPPPPPPAPKPGTKLGELGASYFDFNKAEVKPAGAEILDGIVKTLKDNPGVKVEINGYTDSIGSDAYNVKLSERRADAVGRYLEKQGIESSRISVHGYGKANPVADNKTAEGRAKNRRAELIAR